MKYWYALSLFMLFVVVFAGGLLVGEVDSKGRYEQQLSDARDKIVTLENTINLLQEGLEEKDDRMAELRAEFGKR